MKVKNLIALILCISTLTSVNSQIIIKKFIDDSSAVEFEFEAQIKNGDTIKNGYFKHFYQYSKGLYEEGSFINNKKNGQFITYYENGDIHWLRNYTNNALEGKEEFYNNFGALQFTGLYTIIDSNKTQYKAFYPSGNLKRTIELNNNLFHNVEVIYAENGDPLSFKTFENGVLNGAFWIKNNKKELLQKGYYADNKLNGTVVSYYDGNRLKSVGEFVDGVPHGEMMDYYPSQQLKRQCTYYKDTLNGKCLNFFENGQLAINAYFFKGHFDKTYIEYFDNGQLKDSINYNRSQKNGESKHYSKDGVLLSTENFKNGLYHGKQYSFYPTGALKSKFSYKDGNKNGENYTYFEDGTLESILIFDAQDNIVQQKEFYANKGLHSITIHKYKLDKKSDAHKSMHLAKEKNYTENGALQWTGNYLDYKKHGEWIYFKEKKKTKIEHYKNDKLHGLYTEYYPNKKIKLEGSYIIGNKSGVWTKFAENGGIIEKSSFKNDLLDGEYFIKNEMNEELRGNYKKGKKEGLWITSLEGKEISKENYIKGELIDKK